MDERVEELSRSEFAELIGHIQRLSREELDKVMEAIEKWFAVAHPDWDVVYIAVPKDPDLREKELKSIWNLLARDIGSHRR